MDKWVWICQLAVAAAGALMFLSLVADNLRHCKGDLAACKKAWDREQKKRDPEAAAIEGGTVPPVAMPSSVDDASARPAA